MRPADRAVDPEQIEAVGLAREDALSPFAEPEGQMRERLRPERRRRRQRPVRLALEEAASPASVRKNHASPRSGAASAACAARNALRGIDAPAATASSAR